MNWQPTKAGVWQGRDDSLESPLALRMHQAIKQCHSRAELEQVAQDLSGAIALMGFASDEGVRRNQGRVGAVMAPPVLRQAWANFASLPNVLDLIDMGDWIYEGSQLEQGQHAVSSAVRRFQQQGGRTLIIGGGHETAWAHGRALFEAYPDKHLAIINFDPHLDLRRSNMATSGTPFAQLAAWAQEHKRYFDYTCIGASLAHNTQALVQDAAHLGVQIAWDEDVNWGNVGATENLINQALERSDIVYMTIDLDVLPSYQMPAVSAPAALGIGLDLLIHLMRPILKSGKLVGADAVEFNPNFDIDKQGARVAARVLWQIATQWKIV